MKSREFIKLIFRAMSNFDITGDEGCDYLMKYFERRISDAFFRGVMIGMFVGAIILYFTI